ncbi:MAG: FHA domain-containing protein, partial [Bacteroidales bacterium]|nr:FHA domain-containing protein [Bacteroidales bacterium]
TNPKNPIKVNGKPLGNVDVVLLQWGDRLTFGHTELIFERPHYNEDQTIIEG